MDILKRLFKNPASAVGIVLLFGFFCVAIFAEQIAPPPANSRDPYMIPRDGFKNEPQPPSAEHIFGTTEGQYDIFYGVIWGTRTAFRVGVVITIITLIIGLVIGSISGFYSGWADEILMRGTEVFMAFPFLLAAITLTSVLQTVYGRAEGGFLMFFARGLSFITFGTDPRKDINPVQVQILTGMLAIIIFGWMTYARVIRGNILSVREYEYTLAARVIGAKDTRILFRHLLPNAVFPVLVLASMDIGSYVLTFAALSFLGLGAQTGYADWGQMISFAAQLDSIPRHSLVYCGVSRYGHHPVCFGMEPGWRCSEGYP